MTDPLGNTSTYEYDANGNLIRVTDPLGNVPTYTYDSRGNRLTETDANGNTTTYSYDVMDRLVSVTDALSNTTTYTHDANANRTSETDANGNIRTFAYDAYNRLIQETDPLGNTISYSYDSRDNRISMTDANGNTISYTYNILDRLIGETNALGGQKNYIYDAAGNLLTVTDANEVTTSFTYDANNRQISEMNAAGEATSYTYDAKGNLTAQALPNGNTITSTFDSLGRLVGVSDTLGPVRNYAYDIIGSLLAESDPLGNTISYSYDANGRAIQKTDAMGNSTNYTYNAVGNLITVTDREGNTTSYLYDGLGRRISESDQLGNTMVFSYDNVGNIVSVTDANGNTTSYTYNIAKRLVQETYADGTTRSFGYDPSGNMISRTDQNANVTAYVYDALNRKIKLDYPGSNDSEYTYDGVGNILTANNQNATISFAYDNAYRLAKSVQSGQTVSYSYDIPNRSRTITYPSGKVIKEVRNPRGSFVRLENASGQAIMQYTYDSADRLQTKSYQNGITTNFINNANGWVTDLNYNKQGTQIVGFRYGFDKEGNRLYTDSLHDAPNSEQYVYDGKYRLLHFKLGILDQNKTIQIPVTQTAYNLGPLGNWVEKTTDGIAENRTHNEMNEIKTIDGVSQIYDDNGNLVDDGTYEYDYENRLVRVTQKSDTSIIGEYKYDALGRRIEKKISDITVTFVYDDIEDKILEEHSINYTKSYTYGNSINEIISMEFDGKRYFYHSNSLGSIIAITDEYANVVETYRYEAYGYVAVYDALNNLIGHVSGAGNPFFFTARYLDQETSLYYFYNRSYSPILGRFLQHDPLEFIDSMNFYEYVENNPINRIDPTGLSWSITGGWFAAKKLRLVVAFGKSNGYPLSAELLEYSLNNPKATGFYSFPNSYPAIKASSHYQRERDKVLWELCCFNKRQGHIDLCFEGGDLGYSIGHLTLNVTNVKCTKNAASFHAYGLDPYDFNAQYGWTLGGFKKWLVALWAEQAIEGGYMSDNFSVEYDFDDTASF